MYDAQTERIPLDLQNTCSAVLFACMQTISVHLGDCEVAYYPENQVLASDGILTVPVAGEDATFSSLLLRYDDQDVASQVRNDITLSEADDGLTLRCAAFVGAENANPNPSRAVDLADQALYLEVLEFERRALVRRQVVRMLATGTQGVGGGSGGSGIPVVSGFPSSSLPYNGRAVDETEVLSFSPLCAADFYRAHQLLEASKFMLPYMPPPPLFTRLTRNGDDDDNAQGGAVIHARSFFRNVSAATLSQILAKESIKEPMVLKSYYPATDHLFYILHYPPPHRRMGRASWSPKDSVSSAAVTPAVKSGRAASPPKSARVKPQQPDWSKFKQDTVTITPAGNAIVMIKVLASTRAAWLSIHIADVLIGLRAAEQGGLVRAQRGGGQQRQPPQQEQQGDGGAASPPPSMEGTDPAEEQKGSTEGEAAAEAAGGAASDKAAEVARSGSGEDKAEGGGGGDAAAEAGADGATASPQASQASQAKQAKQAPPQQDSGAVFFCHTEDGVRIVACAGPNPQPSRKPDKLGSVCLMATMPSGMCVTACSNGTIRVSSAVDGLLHPGGKQDYLGEEIGRFIAAGGTVVRTLGHGPYVKDMLSPDGTRTLFNATPGVPIATQYLRGFHARLLKEAPARWTYVRLSGTGSVEFFDLPPGSEEPPQGGQQRYTPPSLCDISSSSTDAESTARVISYQDGRVLVLHRDTLREATFPDGTTIQTGGAAVVFVSKPGLPSVEVDLDIDRMSFRHAQGLQVPIAKGGERVRARVALQDGSALMIKYDTRITSATNGSLKLVRRDRSVIVALDNGQVDYFPASAWTAQAQGIFEQECEDGWTPPVVLQHAPMGSAASLSRQTLLQPSQSVTFAADESRDVVDKLGALAGLGKASLVDKSQSTLGKKSSKLRQPIGARGSEMGSSLVEQSKSTYSVRSKASNKDKDKASASFVQSDQAAATAVEPDLQTSYCINIFDSTCRIEDFEYNCFEMSLSKPLEPKVELAGEVEGLTPTAITATPMEPRVFLVSRDAAACEALGGQQVAAMVAAAERCPDAVRFSVDVPAQAAERAGSATHTIFTQRRTGRDADVLNFGQIFAPRPWQSCQRPATVSLVLRRSGATAPNATTRPRIFETISLVERAPLTDAEYVRLEDDIARCQAFQAHRLVDMDRFTVGDPRSSEELEEEERLVARLKQAFKVAKVAAGKKKDAGKASGGGGGGGAGAGADGYQGQRPPPLQLEATSTIDEGNEFLDEEVSEVRLPLLISIYHHPSLLIFLCTSAHSPPPAPLTARRYI